MRIEEVHPQEERSTVLRQRLAVADRSRGDALIPAPLTVGAIRFLDQLPLRSVGGEFEAARPERPTRAIDARDEGRGPVTGILQDLGERRVLARELVAVDAQSMRRWILAGEHRRK